MNTKKFSLKKKDGKWILSLENGKVRIHNKYNNWKEAIQKVNEIFDSWRKEN